MDPFVQKSEEMEIVKDTMKDLLEPCGVDWQGLLKLLEESKSMKDERDLRWSSIMMSLTVPTSATGRLYSIVESLFTKKVISESDLLHVGISQFDQPQLLSAFSRMINLEDSDEESKDPFALPRFESFDERWDVLTKASLTGNFSWSLLFIALDPVQTPTVQQSSGETDRCVW